MKILSYIFSAFLVIVILSLLVSLLPIPGNAKFLVVLSGSMEPSIKTGSVIIVKSAKTYNIGDIITFGEMKNGKVPITHRVVDIRVDKGNPIYFTKGDANEDIDQKQVSHREVLGKTLFAIPYLGYVAETVKKPYGFFILVAVPALIVVWGEVEKIVKEVKRLKAEKKSSES